ncbi:inositol polyphosphate 5-phosphatase, partial [Tulasnella sp. 427]
MHSTGDYADIGVTNFDFHNEVRMRGHDSLVGTVPRLEGVRRSSEQFGFLTCSSDSDEPMTEQRGVFRINCLDCLDRTNFVQDIISRTTLEQFLFNINQSWVNSGGLWGSHRELWAESGDALSKIYAGTGALNTSFTRTGKRTLAGVLSDATKSVSRAYINNFQDKGKQTAIDMFLGNISSQPQVLIFDPIHDSVRAILKERVAEYSSRKSLSIFAGTYNLNGRPPTEPLHPWLFPDSENTSLALTRPDILVVGFQEIVPLNAQQIIQADPAKKREWEAQIQKTIGTRGNYLIFRSEQLVGTALFVIVKAELAGALRNVEAATRKTGLRGMAGNKGAVAIRFDLYDTSFCFLTAHLAAGHTNVMERNNDYDTIDSGLRFTKGRNIKSHDVVIWAADTNYRIDLDNEDVRSFATSDNFEPLVMADQLLDAMHANEAFSGYQEGPLMFPPTYRYDLHSNQYDTSEKMRIPAWTDRILYRGLPKYLQLMSYSRADLRGSDHRPVYALFKCDVLVIDVAKKNALQEELLKELTHTGGDELLEDKRSRTVVDGSISDD